MESITPNKPQLQKEIFLSFARFAVLKTAFDLDYDQTREQSDEWHQLQEDLTDLFFPVVNLLHETGLLKIHDSSYYKVNEIHKVDKAIWIDVTRDDSEAAEVDCMEALYHAATDPA